MRFGYDLDNVLFVQIPVHLCLHPFIIRLCTLNSYSSFETVVNDFSGASFFSRVSPKVVLANV